jgi:hypothetical protein
MRIPKKPCQIHVVSLTQASPNTITGRAFKSLIRNRRLHLASRFAGNHRLIISTADEFDVASELAEKDSKKEKKIRFQRARKVIGKFMNFLGRRHIWSGLLAGFLWAFPEPFVLYTLHSANWNLSLEALWIFFFPITSSLYLLSSIMDTQQYVDAVVLWGLSMIIGMIIGVAVTYSIHRIRVWRRMHHVSSKMPSE